MDISTKDVLDMMDKISLEEMEKFVLAIEEVGTAQMQSSWFTMFEYMGFDPEKIIRKMIVLAKQQNEGPEQMKVDVMYAIAAYIYLGNLSNPKALTRRAKGGVDAVTMLTNKYQIVHGATGTGISPETVTFPRIANAFPVMTTRLATILPSNNFPGKPFKSQAVPRFMRQNAFASFISHDLSERTALFLLNAMCAYSADLSLVYEEGRRKKSKDKTKISSEDAEEAAIQQMTFISNARGSKVPSSESKKALMLQEFKVETLYQTLKPVVENYMTLTTDGTDMVTEKEFKADLNAYYNMSV